MTICETCGNEYGATMQITLDGQTHTFDCFECAIHALAPRCRQCDCRVIGHGVEAAGSIYCCANCARRTGIEGLCDHETVLQIP